MLKEKDRQSIDIARLYYESEYSQQQISDLLNISRPTISKLLNYAKEKGYVTVQINDPADISNSLSIKLKNKYNLDDAIIAHCPLNNDDDIKNHIGRIAAKYLYENIKDNDIIGISWGTTMYSVAKQLINKNLKNVQVVQLKGGLSYTNSNTYAPEIVQLFTDAFHACGRSLPLPVVFDTPKLKEITEKDSHISEIIKMGKKANVAVFSIGTVRDNALLFRLGYFNEDEKKRIQDNAVGDICSRFFDINGEICDSTINARTVGIELDELKKKQTRILVAGGQKKVDALHVALFSKIANVLVTDQYTAELLLKK